MGALDDFLEFISGRKALKKAAGTEGDVTQGATPTPKTPPNPGNSISDIASAAEQQAKRSRPGFRGVTSTPPVQKKKRDSEGYSAY